MNPFELPGPQFLAFYALFGAATLAVVYQARRWAEAGEPGRVPVSDPYAIAYLRGGPTEAVRLGVTVLIDRELLEITEDVVERRKGVKPAHGTNTIERGILEECDKAKAVRDLATTARLQELARKSCEPDLIRLGLIASPEVMSRRQMRVALAVIVLLTVAATKVAIGLSRNRPVSFLVLSAIVFSVATFFLVRGFRTSRGERALGDLRTLFDALRGRAEDLRPNASTSELALLMAVYGLDAVSVYQFPYVKAFHRRPVASGVDAYSASSCGGASYDGSSGSSCGGGGGGASSCGGGGGSSCGGGGGGCGGCGGS